MTSVVDSPKPRDSDSSIVAGPERVGHIPGPAARMLEAAPHIRGPAPDNIHTDMGNNKENNNTDKDTDTGADNSRGKDDTLGRPR